MPAGRPKVYSDDVVMKLVITAVTNQIGTFQGLHRYLKEHPAVLAEVGLAMLPSRRTLSRRLQKAAPAWMKTVGRPPKSAGEV